MEAPTTTPAETPLPTIDFERLRVIAAELRGYEKAIFGQRCRLRDLDEPSGPQPADLARLEEVLGQAETSLFRVANVGDSYLSYPGSADVIGRWHEPVESDADET